MHLFLNQKSSYEDKFIKLDYHNTNMKILRYLYDKFTNLNINILYRYYGSIFGLMEDKKLITCCWPTTESAIVFLNDDDYIERGNLYLDDTIKEYYHSWIVFKYNNREYVFDPCLALICSKEKYHKVFMIDVMGKTTAKEVRDELINVITSSNKDNDSYKTNQDLIKIVGNKYDQFLIDTKDEVKLDYLDGNPNMPLYRNASGYRVDIKDDKIIKMNVNYYLKGM